MKAWLLTWEWSGEAAAVADAIAAILSPRYSLKRVAETVEFYYAKRFSTAAELRSYAGASSRNPYRAEIDFNCIIACGHNPHLRARLVSDLSVSIDPATGNEIISWIEPPLYKSHKSGFPTVIHPAKRMRCIREIKGALSDELIWDRAKDRSRPGWGSRKPGHPIQEILW